MTAAEKLEQAVSRRPDSLVPGRAAERLLKLEPAAEPDVRPRMWAMHVGMAAGVGVLRGVMAFAGLRGPWASAMFTVVRLTADQTVENWTGVGAPPWTWPRDELLVDVAGKAVYAFVTGAVADRLRAAGGAGPGEAAAAGGGGPRGGARGGGGPAGGGRGGGGSGRARGSGTPRWRVAGGCTTSGRWHRRARHGCDRWHPGDQDCHSVLGIPNERVVPILAPRLHGRSRHSRPEVPAARPERNSMLSPHDLPRPGATIAWWSGGTTGPTVVLLHGATLDHRAWAPQVEDLADRYRVVVPDLRGHGASTGHFAFEDAVQDVLALLDELAAPQVVLV